MTPIKKDLLLENRRLGIELREAAETNGKLMEELAAARAETTRLTIRLGLHHFGDHSEECDDCGAENPSEDAIRTLTPLGFIANHGSTLYRGKAEAALAKAEKEPV